MVLSDSGYKDPTLNALVKCFELDRTALETTLATKPNSRYEKLIKELTQEQIKEFQDMAADTAAQHTAADTEAQHLHSHSRKAMDSLQASPWSDRP